MHPSIQPAAETRPVKPSPGPVWKPTPIYVHIQYTRTKNTKTRNFYFVILKGCASVFSTKSSKLMMSGDEKTR